MKAFNFLSHTCRMEESSPGGGLWQPKGSQKLLSPYGRQPEFLSKSSRRDYGEPIWESPSSPNSWSGRAKGTQYIPCYLLTQYFCVAAEIEHYITFT